MRQPAAAVHHSLGTDVRGEHKTLRRRLTLYGNWVGWIIVGFKVSVGEFVGVVQAQGVAGLMKYKGHEMVATKTG